MAKKKRKRKSPPTVDTTVEIKLPPRLIQIVEHLRADEARKLFLDQTIKAVFENDVMFGITAVRLTSLTKADLAKAKRTGRDKDDHVKLCEGE